MVWLWYITAMVGKIKYMASACLAGVNCRYDGTSREDAYVSALFKKGLVIPFCPEIFGEMGIPRKRVQIIEGDGNDVIDNHARVMDADETDRTEQMIKGAEKTAAFGTIVSPEIIFLKSKSPSCGVSPKIGVTTALLMKSGFNLREVGE